ncbi:MAG: septum site-determining protein MinD [Vulcanimicrobiota bacterium]
MGKVLVITSGKGGVGKTTAVANIGSGLAMEGKKVVIIDADIGLRNLDLVMGLENRIIFDLVDVIEKKCRSYRQAMIRDKRFKNLFLIPAAQSRDKMSVTPEQMKELCDNLKKTFDFILIDCPAGIEHGFKNAIAGADEAIVVTNPEVSAVRDADRIIGLWEAEEKGPAYLLINRMKPELVKRGQMLSEEDVIDALKIELIGVIPEDENILFSSNQGEPAVLNKKSLAGRNYRRIIRKIIDPNAPDEEPENLSLWEKIKRFFNRGQALSYK